MKIGKYILLETERETFIVSHESGEAMEVTEERLEAALNTLWEEGF